MGLFTFCDSPMFCCNASCEVFREACVGMVIKWKIISETTDKGRLVPDMLCFGVRGRTFPDMGQRGTAYFYQ